MLILPQTVMVKWVSGIIKWYESKGYKYTKMYDEFEVNVEDLSKGSHIMVEVLCDYCLENGTETIINRSYKDYLRHNNNLTEKDSCKKCGTLKQEQTMLKNYGVKHALQNKEILNKQIQTNVERYGVEHAMQSMEIQEKFKQTCLVKYGCENPFQDEEVKEKIKQTNIKNLGVENPNQNKEVQEKKKQTNLERYGTEYPMQSEEIKEKAKQTCLEIYGVENCFSHPDIIQKVKDTMQEKYGVDYYSQTDEWKEKYKNTVFERYGVEHPMYNEAIKKKVREKVIISFYNNGTIKTSSQQIEVYNILKDNNYNIYLNYPLSSINLDVAIFIDNIKIDLEYDSWYWHQDKNRDRKRDEFTKSQGWKILRIRSGHKVPTFEQLKESINILINSDKKFTQIILDDWKIENKEVQVKCL